MDEEEKEPMYCCSCGISDEEGSEDRASWMSFQSVNTSSGMKTWCDICFTCGEVDRLDDGYRILTLQNHYVLAAIEKMIKESGD